MRRATSREPLHRLPPAAFILEMEIAERLRRAASYAILRGAKPAGLPVEQASNFELVLNLQTGKALGITLPTSITTARKFRRELCVRRGTPRTLKPHM